ncbi:MAG: flagellar type III secretion system protein FliR [Lachnospiraceae bacterium]|nr:flagellar type III secretion system protein FliR [Lachnospiraceae bacterium]
MLEHSFSIYHLEYYLVILVRVAGVIAFAPIFGNRTVTRRVKLFLSIAMAYIIYSIHPYVPLDYTTFLQYTVIMLRELVVGVTLGFVSSIALSIIGMAGQFIDREMGFSMVSNFDPGMNTDTTITAEFYNMLVMLIMLCSNMHYFILSALADSFELIPVGQVTVDSGRMYDVMLEYMVDYFVIAMRISLPILISIMLLNVVLGVLAKTAPQMNMFVIGIQLKVFVGLAVLFVTLSLLTNVTEFIYRQMQQVVTEALQVFY